MCVYMYAHRCVYACTHLNIRINLCINVHTYVLVYNKEIRFLTTFSTSCEAMYLYKSNYRSSVCI